MPSFYQTSKITLVGIYSLSQHTNNRQTRLSALCQFTSDPISIALLDVNITQKVSSNDLKLQLSITISS